MKNKIKAQYDKVFNKDGEIQLTGRKECIKLISLLEETGDNQVDFGNVDTGFMNVKNIKEYVKGLE